MSKQRRLAVSYSRFSDPKQSAGDSADRQDRDFRQFCQLHDLTPSGEVYADRGRSGYHDEHRRKGRLGQLVAFAKEGRFEPGTVVVVEAWDRLGRLRPDKQTALVAELVQTGVSIGVCRLNDIFAEDDFGTHKWTTLAVFIQLAYQESKQKAERVAASWAKRREKAQQEGRQVGCPLPAWVEKVNPEEVGGAVRLTPGRAEALRRIFRLAAEGLGHSRIAAALTAGGVKAFGRSGRWTVPYIANLLNDRRAVGEAQFYKGTGEPDGKPLAGYFPAAVSEEEYQLARAAQESRLGTDAKGRALVPRQSRYVNVFKGLLTHARDGAGMALHNHGQARDGTRLVLMNSAAVGASGRNRTFTFPYHVFEQAVLGLLREVDPAEVLPRPAEERDRLAVLRSRLANVRQDIGGLQEELKAGFSKALAAVLREKEAEEERVGQELQEELARSVRPAEKAWRDLPSLVDIVREGGDEARLKLRPVLRRVVEGMHVLIVRRGAWRLCAVQAYFAEGGARRDYLITYRPAGNGRGEAWRAWSLSEVAGPADLDLRKQAHARQLEKLLGAIDPAALGELE
jgi:DNA invertase Pin-like site-specific DNA recombinase